MLAPLALLLVACSPPSSSGTGATCTGTGSCDTGADGFVPTWLAVSGTVVVNDDETLAPEASVAVLMFDQDLRECGFVLQGKPKIEAWDLTAWVGWTLRAKEGIYGDPDCPNATFAESAEMASLVAGHEWRFSAGPLSPEVAAGMGAYSDTYDLTMVQGGNVGSSLFPEVVPGFTTADGIPAAEMLQDDGIHPGTYHIASWSLIPYGVPSL